MYAQQPVHLRGIEVDPQGLAGSGVAVHVPIGYRAPGQLAHQLGGALHGGHRQVGVHESLEPVRRLGRQFQEPRRAPDAQRVEVRRLQEHVAGAFPDLAILAAHHPRERQGRLTSQMASIFGSSWRSTWSRVASFSPGRARRTTILCPSTAP